MTGARRKSELGALRPSVHNSAIRFRASDSLIAGARAKAKRDGMSFSELMRAALRRELEAAPRLGADNTEPTATAKTSPLAVAPNGALGPIASKAIADAARGDVSAQRQLFQACFDGICSPTEHPLNAQYVVMEAMVVGRLIAAHGFPDDIRKFAAGLVQGANILRRAGRPDIADHMVAEAISVLEQMADCGDDLSAVCSQVLVRREAPGVAEQAKTMRRKAVETEVN